MRLGSIISETLRNIASGTAHALVMFLAVLFAGTLLGGYEAMSVMRLETEAAVRIRAFADVKTVVGGNVDGLACDRLSDHGDPSFISGAMRSGPQVVPLATKGIELSSYEVTAGMMRLITAGDPQEVPDSSGCASNPLLRAVTPGRISDFGFFVAVDSSSSSIWSLCGHCFAQHSWNTPPLDAAGAIIA